MQGIKEASQAALTRTTGNDWEYILLIVQIVEDKW